MKKILLLLSTLLLCFIGVKSQDKKTEYPRYIEITGSAEMDVEPDEIRFIIRIEEYWKEEFEKKKEKDYKTKIPISEIEEKLLSDLSKIGIQRDKIIIKEVGNWGRETGKKFLISKEFELILDDIKKVDEINNTIDTKGIDYMGIEQIKNKKITDYRKQVKIEALKAAKDKAEYLLSSVGSKVGDIISIEEIDNNNNNLFWRPQDRLSNTIMPSSENPDKTKIRKINLKYEIKAKFEIK